MTTGVYNSDEYWGRRRGITYFIGNPLECMMKDGGTWGKTWGNRLGSRLGYMDTGVQLTLFGHRPASPRLRAEARCKSLRDRTFGLDGQLSNV